MQIWSPRAYQAVDTGMCVLSQRHADTCVLVAAFRAEDLHTPRGLATVARALRTLFALSTSGTAPGR
eukprot:scaffold102104_cov24-Tisochrysis_lutea.AAC.2